MTTLQIRILFYLLVAGLGPALFFVWLGKRDLAAASRATIEQTTRTDKATTGIAEDAGAAREVIHKTEVVVSGGREDYMRGYEDAKRDAAVSVWVDEPVPQRLRDLARERRASRERSGSNGDGRRVDAPQP